MQDQTPIRVLVIGSVDHGKSTLIGRILVEHEALDETRCKIVRDSGRWADALDAFQQERQQNVTIEKAFARLKVGHRTIDFIDCPGHIEFFAAALSGGTQADAAIVICAADEPVSHDLLRFFHLLRIYGIHDIIVAITKIDAVDNDPARIARQSEQVNAIAEQVGVMADLRFVPLSAQTGENVSKLIEILKTLRPVEKNGANANLLLPVQDVVKHGDGARVLLGRVMSGRIANGDDVMLFPSGYRARVQSVQGGGALHENVAIELDRPLFARRGDMIVSATQAATPHYDVTVEMLWCAKAPPQIGQSLMFTAYHSATPVTIVEAHPHGDGGLYDLWRLTLKTMQPVLFLGTPHRVALRTQDSLVAVGHMQEGASRSLNENLPVGAAHVSYANPLHRPGILWLSGLSGAGKTTLAVAVQTELLKQGWTVVRLDGDHVRGGLCADLGFDENDRYENIRRSANVATLMKENGAFVIASFITPQDRMRMMAREIAGPDLHHVHVDCPLEICIQRDPKHLYQKAQSGDLSNMTGIASGFETPMQPDLYINTHESSLKDCVAAVLAHARTHFGQGVS